MSGHCPGCGVYHEEDDNRKCAKCKVKATSDQTPKALEHHYTVKEYVCLPGDRTAYYAINEESGIMCPGRDTLDLALQDAEALNAAVKRATESLRARVAELEKIEAEAKEWRRIADLAWEMSRYAASSRTDNTEEFVDGLMEEIRVFQTAYKAARAAKEGGGA